ncbi:hypothetical protein [Saccharicrinis sp. FJH54]|uniref:hypothetical protein n=1 Tax=Saccharicrinis sp. FJH54 TaxID=3344665 RepID=UPI0035D41AD7
MNELQVQPYYLIDEKRLSLRNELLAQKDIKKEIFFKFPFTRELILPTKFYSVSDLKDDAIINKNYNILNNNVGFGIQYQWLATFCKKNKLYDLELSFEKAENGKKGNFLRPYMSSCIKNNSETFRILDNDVNSAVNQLFKYYYWPLWNITRQDMIVIANDFSFTKIMDLTWFCHTPIKGKPCGTCNPCKDVVDYGMDYRLNKKAKLRYHVRNLKPRSLVHFIKKYVNE